MLMTNKIKILQCMMMEPGVLAGVVRIDWRGRSAAKTIEEKVDLEEMRLSFYCRIAVSVRV